MRHWPAVTWWWMKMQNSENIQKDWCCETWSMDGGSPPVSSGRYCLFSSSPPHRERGAGPLTHLPQSRDALLNTNLWGAIWHRLEYNYLFFLLPEWSGEIINGSEGPYMLLIKPYLRCYLSSTAAGLHVLGLTYDTKVIIPRKLKTISPR